jgi:deazaflavin-dependent oxidoreductase (nitroreductase family)
MGRACRIGVTKRCERAVCTGQRAIVAVMPSNFVLKTMNAAHRCILKVTGGRRGWEAGKMPVVELTTTGRTSGLPRTVLLTSPYRDGDTLVLVASRGGDDRHPDWFLNLQNNPDVQVSVQGQPLRSVIAHVATPAERAVLWTKVIADHQNYAGYQDKTDRQIPLILLDLSAPAAD